MDMLVNLVVPQARTIKVSKHLAIGSELLEEHQSLFSNYHQDFPTLCCYEDQDTLIPGLGMRRVRVLFGYQLHEVNNHTLIPYSS